MSSGTSPSPPTVEQSITMLWDSVDNIGNEIKAQTPDYIQEIINVVTGVDDNDVSLAKLEKIKNLYRDLADGTYDNGTGAGAQAIPPEFYREITKIIKLREKALKKISEERKKLGPTAKNTLMDPGESIDDFVLSKNMSIDDYYNEVLVGDPLFNNFNGVTDLGGLTLDLNQVMGLLINPAASSQIVNTILNLFFTKAGYFRKEAYEMQTLSCLYTNTGGPGELTFDVSPANTPNRFTMTDRGIVVNTADPVTGTTHGLPVRSSYDYQNLTKVASMIRKSDIASADKITYLDKCQSFPSILRIEMLRLKGGTRTTNVHKKDNSDMYLYSFVKRGDMYQVPYDETYYKLPQGMMLYARADGIVVHYDSKISKLVAEFPLGTYAFSPDGTTPPFLDSPIQQVIYNELVKGAGTLNVTADQIVDANIQNNIIQQRLVMRAYILNYLLDNDRVRNEFAGRSKGGRRRRSSKSGGGSGSGSKKKLKKMTQKRKNRSKSKSKS